jgi:hypothetical protein
MPPPEAIIAIWAPFAALLLTILAPSERAVSHGQPGPLGRKVVEAGVAYPSAFTPYKRYAMHTLRAERYEIFFRQCCHVQAF